MEELFCVEEHNSSETRNERMKTGVLYAGETGHDFYSFTNVC